MSLPSLRRLRQIPSGTTADERRGVTLALLAPDGAGKSTAVRCLRRALPFPVRDVYLGLYPRDERAVSSRPKGLGTIVRLLRQWRGYLVGRHHRRLGRVVLFDRYCYDARLDRGAGTWTRRARSWVLGHACPPPDLTVVLDAPGTLLHARKPEHGHEELERQRRGYLALAQRYGWHVIDASQDADVVCDELTDLIWRARHGEDTRSPRGANLTTIRDRKRGAAVPPASIRRCGGTPAPTACRRVDAG